MSIICGDCLEEMRKMEDNSISAIVTDPPYGLSFMGKGWDHAVPGKEYWEECLRISKPGSFLVAMGGTRTFHRLASSIEDAGWEIRDTIMWIYGSGFPKSHNHFGISGYGTALKPAYEPILVAMKKCDGTFKQNAEKWGQAGINIDGCRVATTESTFRPNGVKGEQYCGGYAGVGIGGSSKGRWPANVILDEKAGAMLDEQSGISKSSDSINHETKVGGAVYGWANSQKHLRSGGHNDSGGASRFFYCAKASASERNEGLEILPDKILKTHGDIGSCDNAKPSSQTGTIVKNNHPTVKPLKLMEYLIKLIMPPKDGILLDPFAGSGTTVLAAHKLGLKCIGIEKSQEYCDIANARVAHYIQNNLMFG